MKTGKHISTLSAEGCNDCPRNCNARRQDAFEGYCKTGNGIELGSVCIHYGEEPVLGGEKGIVNIFFSHCNLQCIYCQNMQISKNLPKSVRYNYRLDELMAVLSEMLENTNYLGFVSPSHCIKQVIQIINALHQAGRKPITVYNSNAYDKVESLKQLEELIDIYLPDFKYADDRLATDYSDVPDYTKTALAAIKEMYRQKGSVLQTDTEGLALSGLIIRHLVLPGAVENSKDVLRLIAEEISPNIHISLMSQYYPLRKLRLHPYLKRELQQREYEEVKQEMEWLGMTKGWIQELSSSGYYRPDFEKEYPFE